MSRRTFYIHERNIDHAEVQAVTFMFEPTKMGFWRIGAAICTRDDNFDRRIGRGRAFSRIVQRASSLYASMGDRDLDAALRRYRTGREFGDATQDDGWHLGFLLQLFHLAVPHYDGHADKQRI